MSTIFDAFLAALRYTLRVYAAYTLPSKAVNSCIRFILMSLCSVYFLPGKFRTIPSGAKERRRSDVGRPLCAASTSQGGQWKTGLCSNQGFTVSMSYKHNILIIRPLSHSYWFTMLLLTCLAVAPCTSVGALHASSVAILLLACEVYILPLYLCVRDAYLSSTYVN